MTFDLLLKIRNLKEITKEFNKMASDMANILADALAGAFKDMRIKSAWRRLLTDMEEGITKLTRNVKDAFNNITDTIKNFAKKSKAAIVGIVMLPLTPFIKFKNLMVGWMPDWMRQMLGVGGIIWGLKKLRDSTKELIALQGEQAKQAARTVKTSRGVREVTREMSKSARNLKRNMPILEFDVFTGYMGDFAQEGITATKKVEGLTEQMAAFGHMVGSQEAGRALVPFVASLVKTGKVTEKELGRALRSLHVGFGNLAPNISDAVFHLARMSDEKIPIDKISKGVAALGQTFTQVGLSSQESADLVNTLLTGELEDMPAIFRTLAEDIRKGDFSGVASTFEMLRKEMDGMSETQRGTFAQGLGLSQKELKLLAASGINVEEVFTKVSSSMKNDGKTIRESMEDATQSPLQKLEKLMGSIESIFIDVADSVANHLDPIVVQLQKLASNIAKAFGMEGVDPRGAIGAIFKRVMETITGWFVKLNEAIENRPKEQSVGWAIWEHIKQSFLGNLDNVVKWVNTAVTEVSSVLDEIFTKVQEVLGPEFSDQGLFGDLWNIFKNLVDIIRDVTDRMADKGLTTVLFEIAAALTAIGGSFWAISAGLASIGGNPLALGGAAVVGGLLAAGGYALEGLGGLFGGDEEEEKGARPTTARKARKEVESALNIPAGALNVVNAGTSEKELLDDIRMILTRIHAVERASLDKISNVADETRLQRIVDQAKAVPDKVGYGQ